MSKKKFKDKTKFLLYGKRYLPSRLVLKIMSINSFLERVCYNTQLFSARIHKSLTIDKSIDTYNPYMYNLVRNMIRRNRLRFLGYIIFSTFFIIRCYLLVFDVLFYMMNSQCMYHMKMILYQLKDVQANIRIYTSETFEVLSTGLTERQYTHLC